MSRRCPYGELTAAGSLGDHNSRQRDSHPRFLGAPSHARQELILSKPIPTNRSDNYCRRADALSLILGLVKRNSDAVIVSTIATGGDFKSLGVTPQFPELRSGSVTAADALHKLALWWDARRFGFVVNARHEQVVNGLLRAIFSSLCGERWARAEDAFGSHSGSPKAVDDLERIVGQSATIRVTFAATLRRAYSKMDGDLNDAAAWYAALANRHRICRDRRLCDFALRLASQPQRLSRIYGSELDGLVHQVSQNPVILRGARLLSLLSASGEHDQNICALPRWKW